MMRKICFVIYNRSNYARLKPILDKIKKDEEIKLQIIVTSAAILNKYGDLTQVIKKDGFRINYSFYSHIEGENNITMTKSVALIINELSAAFILLNPDIVVTIGDRFETMATGICSTFMNFFLTHIQGGELTSSIDEKVRHAITKLSNLHLVCTAKAKKIVEQMGENPKSVYNTGCTSIDLIKKINFKKKVELKKYKFGVGMKVDLRKDYYTVLVHPNTLDYSKNLILVKEIFHSIKKLNTQTIWIWPNLDAGSDIISQYLRTQREKDHKLKINFYKNFEPDEYLKIIKNSLCLIGNSSSGIRESSYLSIPFVNVGNRQNQREGGENLFNSIINRDSIYRNILMAKNKKGKIKKSKIYGIGNASNKIVQILKKVKIDINKSFCIAK